MRILMLGLFLNGLALATCEYSVPEKECRGQREVGNSLVCTDVSDAFKILKAEKGKELLRLPKHVKFRDAIELNFLPDPDSSSIYSYKYQLRDKEDNLVGYLGINGWVNEEESTRLQVTTRYNRKGQLAVINCVEK